MLGYWRFILALMVLLGHGWLPVSKYFGVYAVCSFYVMSGFLITLVLDTKYRGLGGRARFVQNRLLRLYPGYWTALGLAVAATAAGLPGSGPAYGQFHRFAASWLSEATMVGIALDNGPHFIGQTWTVWFELSFYGLMAVGLSSREWLAYLWLAASAAVHASLIRHAAHADWWVHAYATRVGVSFPFAVGASAYWAARRVRWPAGTTWACVGLIAATVAHAVLVDRLWHGPYLKGFYANIALSGAVVATCSPAAIGRRVPRLVVHWDRRLGDLTYPFYLTHNVGLGVAARVLGRHELLGRLDVPAVGLVVTVALSSLILVAVERPVSRIRLRVRVAAAIADRPGEPPPAVRPAAPVGATRPA